MTDPAGPPSLIQVEAWIGRRGFNYWQRTCELIDLNHPGIFEPQWLFGGKKHGWSLRYKKSKSFCTLIPEKNNFRLLIVFGAKERDGVEAIRETLSVETRRAYDEATTYHDGKWLLLTVDNEAVVGDIERLLAVKRRPRPASAR